MLTDTKIRSAKARDKPYKIFDGGGLRIVLNPNGSKWWRLKYRFGGREKSLSLDVYDDTSLNSARAKRAEAHQLLDDGVDPPRDCFSHRYVRGPDRSATTPSTRRSSVSATARMSRRRTASARLRRRALTNVAAHR